MNHHSGNHFFLKLSLIGIILFVIVMGTGRQVFEHYSADIQEGIKTKIEKSINEWTIQL